MNHPAPLTHAILDDWLAAVRGAGAPTAGLGDEQETLDVATRAASTLGLQLPEELKTLWTWRRLEQSAVWLGLSARLLHPNRAAEATTLARQWFREQETEMPGSGGWSESYLIWNAANASWLSVDTCEPGPLSPVYETDDGDMTAPPGRVADSLGELFLHWTALITAGRELYTTHWTYSGDSHPAYPVDGPPTRSP